MKALARYQVILLGEQTHVRCEQLAQGWTGLPSRILNLLPGIVQILSEITL